jgi:hypothetical protein
MCDVDSARLIPREDISKFNRFPEKPDILSPSPSLFLTSGANKIKHRMFYALFSLVSI